MSERRNMHTKSAWLVSVLTLLAVGCASSESSERAPIPTPIPSADSVSLEQLEAASIDQATPVDLAAQVNEPSQQPRDADIVFDMKEEYRLGEPVEIAVRNYSDLDYYYQFQYPACYNLQFFDDSQDSRPYPNADPVLKQRYLSPGRFIVPRGTHCDTIWEKSIDPGQSVVLFTWDQQMCIKDRFGCIESVPVQPGEYLIRGGFSRVERVPGSRPPPVFDANQTPDMITIISWSFTIQPP